MDVYYEDLTTPVIASVPIDLSLILGGDFGWVGFTSGTGSDHQNNDIVSWKFNGAEAAFGCEPCTVELNNSGGVTFGHLGGAGFEMVMVEADCDWTAVPSDSWIVITNGSSGSGSGNFFYTVLPNPGPARSGNITVNEVTYSIDQDAAPPTATPSPTTTPTPTVTATPTPFCCPGDADNSGEFVDAHDFIAVQANFGADCGPMLFGSGVTVVPPGPGVPAVMLEPMPQLAAVGEKAAFQVKLDTNGTDISLVTVFLWFDESKLAFAGGMVDPMWDHPIYMVYPSAMMPGWVCLNAAMAPPGTVNAQGVPVATLEFDVLAPGPAEVTHTLDDFGDSRTFTLGAGFATIPVIAPMDGAAVGFTPPLSPDDVAAVVLALPDEAFKNNPDNRRNTLLNKLNAVQSQIDTGNFNGAINKLENDIRAKTDGCFGGNVGNDWITDCQAQALMLIVIDALLAFLEP